MSREMFLFVILLLLCGLMGWLFFGVEPPPNATGVVHPEFSTMQVGGDPARHESTLLLGWVFVALQIIFFAGLLVMAIGHRLKSPSGGRGGYVWLGLATAALLGVFTLLMRSYSGFMATGAETGLALSFPYPTAWMLYGVWITPLLFIALFIVRFDDWILRPEDKQRFARLVAARKEGK